MKYFFKLLITFFTSIILVSRSFIINKILRKFFKKKLEKGLVKYEKSIKINKEVWL